MKRGSAWKGIQSITAGLIFLLSSIQGLGQNPETAIPERAEDVSPLLIGEKIPQAEIYGPDGPKEQVSALLAGRKTILIIYRGGWCPYCNRHLSDVGMAEKELTDMGYQIIAVSPDAPDKLQHTINKDELGYQLYADPAGKFITAMGLAFRAPGRYGDLLEQSSGGQNEHKIIPVPSLFIVDEEAMITFEYINPDYQKRIEWSLLLPVAEALAK